MYKSILSQDTVVSKSYMIFGPGMGSSVMRIIHKSEPGLWFLNERTFERFCLDENVELFEKI